MDHPKISLILLAALFLLAACSGAAQTTTPSAPAATQIVMVTSADLIQPSPYPASTIAYPSPSPLPEILLPTPYPSVESPPADTETPAIASPATPTLGVVIPVSVYTCNLQGTQLPVWKYNVIQTYNHDRNAYTQGLIIRDGVLYEGTGLRGRSTLRKVDLQTGEVLQSIDLPENFFGEGIVELDGKIYQITWQERTAFVYDFTTFEKLDEFSYATDGWGLTHDGQQLIMTDGTDQLYFIDPIDLQVSGQRAVSDDRGPVYRINELEYVDGEVWGNIYQTACIARIDPKSGKVTGWIDLTGLHDLALQAGQAPVPPEVPNGIAYDPASKRLFVTGKFWPTLYEISLTPVEAQP